MLPSLHLSLNVSYNNCLMIYDLLTLEVLQLMFDFSFDCSVSVFAMSQPWIGATSSTTSFFHNTWQSSAANGIIIIDVISECTIMRQTI